MNRREILAADPLGISLTLRRMKLHTISYLVTLLPCQNSVSPGRTARTRCSAELCSERRWSNRRQTADTDCDHHCSLQTWLPPTASKAGENVAQTAAQSGGLCKHRDRRQQRQIQTKMWERAATCAMNTSHDRRLHWHPSEVKWMQKMQLAPAGHSKIATFAIKTA